jgi:uncharacterized protein YjbI with pentapeptide repeats
MRIVENSKFRKDIMLIDLTEARKNPDQNLKISAYEALKPYKNNSSVYISFTSVDKIGINPTSKYNTPLGIYCYPLKEIWNRYKIDSLKSVGKAVPFAGESSYIWLIKEKTNIRELSLSEYSPRDYSTDREKLISYIENNPREFNKIFVYFSNYNLNRVKMFKRPKVSLKDFLNQDFDRLADEALVNTFAGKIWNITREIADSKQGKPSVQWNQILRRALDYDLVTDKQGRGIIHSAEPVQATFLYKGAFDVVKELLNKDYEKKPFWTDFSGLLAPSWLSEADIEVNGKPLTDMSSVTKNISVDLPILDGAYSENYYKDVQEYLQSILDGLEVNINGGITWNNGTFKRGVFSNSTWKNGTFLGEIFFNSVWQDGYLGKGSFESLSVVNSTWKDGIWDGAIGERSKILGGTIKKGRFEDCKLTNIKSFLINSLRDCVVKNSTFLKVLQEANNCNFIDCSLNLESVLNSISSVFSNVKFKGKYVDYSRLFNSIITDSNINTASIFSSEIYNSKLTDISIDFLGSLKDKKMIISKCNLTNCELKLSFEILKDLYKGNIKPEDIWDNSVWNEGYVYDINTSKFEKVKEEPMNYIMKMMEIANDKKS